MHADRPRDRKQQRAEQHDRRNALQHAAEDGEGQDRYRDKGRRAAGEAGHGGGERAGEAGLREAPGHPGRGADDQEDRPREAGGLHQHRPEPPPVEPAIDQKTDQEAIDDAKGRNFGCRGNPLDHRGADHEGQGQRGQGNDKRPDDLAGPGSLDVAEVLAAIAPPHQRRQRDRQHRARQQAAGEQCRNRDACHRTDGNQHEARRNGFGLRAGGREQRHEIAGPRAARLHLGKQHRCHGGHVGGL